MSHFDYRRCTYLTYTEWLAFFASSEFMKEVDKWHSQWQKNAERIIDDHFQEILFNHKNIPQ